MVRGLVSKLVLTGLLSWLVCLPLGAEAPTPRSAQAAQAVSALVSLAELPPQGTATYSLILQGGPFPYEKDGTVFGNRERLLPAQPRGYYREYTVPTPGLSHRGQRRIVCGGTDRRAPDACYYTADHYASFRRIAP
jgi:ribonuclease T1